MERDTVLKTAEALAQPSSAAAQAFIDHGAGIAAELAQRLAARPDIDRLVGAGNVEMMRDNARNMTRFMGSVFTHFDPAVLVDTVIWVFRAYQSHGFASQFWSAELNLTIEIIEETLAGETACELVPFFDWLVINVPAFTALAEQSPAPAEADVPAH